MMKLAQDQLLQFLLMNLIEDATAHQYPDPVDAEDTLQTRTVCQCAGQSVGTRVKLDRVVL